MPCGVQGYLKISLTLLGPDDKPVAHAADEEDEDEAAGHGALLIPPTLKREVLYACAAQGAHATLACPRRPREPRRL